MEIKTKYNIGDEVWFNREDGRNLSAKIIDFEQSIYGIFYILDYYDKCELSTIRHEDYLFPTKEELLASLK